MSCVFLPELFSLYGPELNSKSRVLLFYKVSNKKMMMMMKKKINIEKKVCDSIFLY